MASPERKKKKKGAKDAATPPASREASAEPRGRSEKKDKKDKKKKKDKSASKEGRSKSKDKKKGKKDRSASKGKKKGVQEEEPAKENKVEAPKEPRAARPLRRGGPAAHGARGRLRRRREGAGQGDRDHAHVREPLRRDHQLDPREQRVGDARPWRADARRSCSAKMPRTRGDGLPRFATGGHDRKASSGAGCCCGATEPFTSIPGLGAAHHDPPHHETDKDRAATKIHALFHRATRTAGGNRRGMVRAVARQAHARAAKRAKFPTSKAPISAVFHSFRLIFGRAIISRNGLEAWMLVS
ncbi:hypothetical protein JL720_15964 [Aureococcus anophagefferens]|nr:hypothetical protein JL720_15964 [Aureococcus anophagefferens]